MQTGVIGQSAPDLTICGKTEQSTNVHRSVLAGLSLVLYLSTLSVDAVRKVTALPIATLSVIYVITVLIYVSASPRAVGPSRGSPRNMPVWLFLLSMWCLAVALIQRIPFQMSLIGWTSYVFFVPLAYIGATLAADDVMAANILRMVAVCGAVIGASTVVGSVLGSSAPVLLQPLVPTAGIHTFGTGNIYLSPSIFATSEQAAEQLLISFFAWIALAHLNKGQFRRMPAAVVGVLIIAGLVFAARRADIYVAVTGTIAVLLIDRIRMLAPSAPRRRGVLRRRFGPTALIAAGSLGLAALLGGNTLGSFLVSGSVGSRVTAMFSLMDSGSLLGQGPGTSNQGIKTLGSAVSSGAISNVMNSYVMNGRTFIAVEGGLPRTWLELGIIGVVLYAAIFLSALSPAIRSLRRLDGVGMALMALACALSVIFLKGRQSLDDPLIQPLFWLAVGGMWGRVRLVQKRS